MAEPRRYQLGRDFTLTLTAPGLGPTDYLVAEFTGPLDDDDAPETTLRTRADQKRITGPGQDQYVLRGPVPDSTPLGTYGLIRVLVHQGPGQPPQEIPPESLPGAYITIEADSPDAPRP